MRVSDLSAPITASKADWLAGSTWLGFSPTNGSLQSQNQCQSTIQRQYAGGYVIEYITEQFSQPNPGFEIDPQYLAERETHKDQAGRFIAIHKLRTTARDLREVIGDEEFKRLQDMWAQGEKRWRWSVAFPIVESYDIVGRPKAKDILGETGYRRLFQRSSATLRVLNDEERASLQGLELDPRQAANAWIGIEDEFAFAEASDIDERIRKAIERDLPDGALEGMESERRAKVRRRAAWLAQKFVIQRRRGNSLFCDHCTFNPGHVTGLDGINPRSLLDVHHMHPIEEGMRYTTVKDFALLCPTCHRIEHARLKVAARK